MSIVDGPVPGYRVDEALIAALPDRLEAVLFDTVVIRVLHESPLIGECGSDPLSMRVRLV